MNIVTKSLVASAVALGLSTAAFAEDDGYFAGIETGFGKLKTELGLSVFGINITSDFKVDAPFYGAKVGYKHFLSPELGVRVYGAANRIQVSNKSSGENSTYAITAYSLNADLLLNLYSHSGVDFGAFVGTSIGYGTGELTEKDGGIDDISLKLKGMYNDFKLGARLSGKQHCMELALKLPYSYVKNNTSMSVDLSEINSIETKMKPDYIISLGYNFSF